MVEKNKSDSATIVRGSIFRVISLFISVAISFYMMPLIVHALGNRWYGMWTLVGTIIGYYGLLDFGLTSAVQTYIARALGKNDPKEIEILISTAFRIFFIAGMIAFSIAVCLGLGSRLFFAISEEAQTFRTVMIILGVSSLLQFSAMAFNGLYTAHYRYDLAAMLETGKLLIRTTALLVALQGNFNIIVLALITVSVDIASTIVKLIVAKVTFGRLYLKFNAFKISRIRKLMTFGGKAFVVNISEILRFKLDALVITSFLSLSAVTVYSIGSQLVMYFMLLVGMLVGVLIPVYARYKAKEDWTAIRILFFKALKISTAASLFFGGAAVVFGRPFIKIWMGLEYNSSVTVMLILIASSIFHVSLQPAANLLYGIARHGAYAKICIFDGIGNLVLSLILVKPFGIYGVAMGTAIPMAISTTWLIFHVTKILDVRVSDYIHYVGKTLVVGITSMGIGYLFIKYQSITNFSSLFSYASGLLILEMAIFYFVIFDPQERHNLKILLLNTVGM